MPEQIGPHLLGRKYVPDERDWRIEKLRALTGPPEALLDETVGQAIDDSPFFQTWKGFLVLWAWIKKHLHPTPPPTPTGTPAWEDPILLDQGDTPHCVGFGWAGWGNTAPVMDKYQNADGHAIYYEAKVFDGEPGQENGSEVRSGAKAMQQRGRLVAYAFARNVSEIDDWLDTHGPVVMGTNWYTGMFEPDHSGYVHLTGSVEGGHCWEIRDRLDNGDYLARNSWGNWGPLHGDFKVKRSDLSRLLSEYGEGCFALELPLA